MVVVASFARSRTCCRGGPEYSEWPPQLDIDWKQSCVLPIQNFRSTRYPDDPSKSRSQRTPISPQDRSAVCKCCAPRFRRQRRLIYSRLDMEDIAMLKALRAWVLSSLDMSRLRLKICCSSSTVNDTFRAMADAIMLPDRYRATAPTSCSSSHLHLAELMEMWRMARPRG